MIGFFEIRNSSEGFLKAILLFCFVFFLRVFLLLGFFQSKKWWEKQDMDFLVPFFSRVLHIYWQKSPAETPNLLQTGKAQTKHKDLVAAQLEGLSCRDNGVWFRRHSLVLYIHLSSKEITSSQPNLFVYGEKKGMSKTISLI